MDSFPERLRSLTNNKYFAFLAVIFFAFLIALVVALFSLGPNMGPQNTQTIRDSVVNRPQDKGIPGESQGGLKDGTANPRTPAPDDSGTTASSPLPTTPSVLDRIISAITGKAISRPAQPSSSTDTTAPGATSLIEQEKKEAEAYRAVFREAKKAPRISIEKYVLTTELPETPTSLTAYELKHTFSDVDVSELAGELGFASIDAVEKRTNLSQLYDIGNQHYLGFDTKTGEFSYLSEKGFAPSRTSSDPKQTAKTVLTDIGYDDPTIRPYATYKRTDEPGFIFIELHRDWERMGAPIMNPIGMLNLTELDRLDRISIESQPDNYVEDTFVTATSDGTDGRARPSSFNTATVKLSLADNRVYALSSNIPRIISSEVLAADSIMSPLDAFDAYKSGQTSFGLTAPSGSGSVNLADVYSNDLAASPVVNVSDFELIYAASQTDQPQWWCPAYALRSFGKVQTGFDVQFSHSVPASRDPRCQTAVLGATTKNPTRTLAQAAQPTPTPDPSRVIPTIVGGVGSASSLQYGTLAFKVDTVIETPNNECPTEFNHSYLIDETKDYSDFIAWIDLNVGFREPYIGSKRRKILLPPEDQSGKGRDNFIPRQWYFVRKGHAGAESNLEAMNPKYSGAELFNLRTKAMNGSSIGNPSVSPLDPKVSGLETLACLHIVTASPWIYTYAPQTSSEPSTDPVTIQLNPIGGVAYVNPPFTSNTDAEWSFSAHSDGTLSFENGLVRDGLFWEYYRDDVNTAYSHYTNRHAQPDDGFVVATDQLPSFFAGLAARIGLTPTEQAHARAELNRESMQFTSPFVKVRFAPQDFLDTYMELSVSPKPDSRNRIYFEFSPLDSYERITQPVLPNIRRQGLTIVETGFIVRN